jgi:hypothetical protein
MLCLPYAYVFSSTKLRDKGRTGSAWKLGEKGGESGGGGQREEMTQIMNTQVNK